MTKYAYVYILSNSFRKLYIGITTDLQARTTQHKNKTNPDCHTAKYGIDELVYFERFTTIVAAYQTRKGPQRLAPPPQARAHHYEQSALERPECRLGASQSLHSTTWT